MNLQPSRLTRVVDIGANPLDGGEPPYLPLLRQRLCEVVGFEPQASELAELQRRGSPLERYLPYVIADGRQHELRVCRATGMTSLFEPDSAALALFGGLKECAEVVERKTVDTRRLDDVAEIESIDFLKMDVQGSELMVLKNGRLKLLNAVAIQAEVSFITLYHGQPTFGAIDDEMRRQGFVPHCFAAVKRWPISPAGGPSNQLLEADIVYVRDITKPELMSSDELRHLALIAHHCYGSRDLAGRCRQILVWRGAVPA